MQYTLWSHGTIIGYTDLDIECINDNLRMGFLEPTAAGHEAILDATGVHAVCAKWPAIGNRHRDDSDPEYIAEFMAACARREALDLELRDETGALFPCVHMRITDHFLQWPKPEEEDDPLDDPTLDPELRAMIESDMADMEEWIKQADEDAAADAWKYDDEVDSRYDTMQYTIQVVLRDEPLFPDEPWRSS